MWKCIRCGTEVIYKNSEECLLDKYKRAYNKTSISLFMCPSCYSWADEIEGIAEWEEEKVKNVEV